MSALETLDVGQANELKLAFRRTGWSNEEVKQMCEGDRLVHIREYLLGFAEIRYPEHFIDCDADPFVPEGWSVAPESDQISNHVCGFFKWNPAAVRLYLSDHQRDGQVIKGNKLRQELASQPVLNANVLDYLLAHPHLIPEEWKGRWVFFWGTIYRDPHGYLYVRCLYWDDGRWDWDYDWLDGGWFGNSPAARGASI